MANYENGLETKAKIIDTCKKLFYSKGFKKTTFKDISQLASVNQGLIVYYYKTKNILANTVFQDVMTEMLKQIRIVFPQEDTLTQFFIDDFLYFRLLYDDEAFRDFMESCCSNGTLNKNSDNFNDEYREQYNEIINYFDDEYISDNILKGGLIAVFDGMKDIYTLYICKNFQNIEIDVATTNYITIYCHLMNIPSNIYGAKMLQAQLLSNRVEVSVKDFRFLIK